MGGLIAAAIYILGLGSFDGFFVYASYFQVVAWTSNMIDISDMSGAARCSPGAPPCGCDHGRAGPAFDSSWCPRPRSPQERNDGSSICLCCVGEMVGIGLDGSLLTRDRPEQVCKLKELKGRQRLAFVLRSGSSDVSQLTVFHFARVMKPPIEHFREIMGPSARKVP